MVRSHEIGVGSSARGVELNSNKNKNTNKRQDLISYYADTEESGILLERANNGFVQFYHTSSVSVSSDERLYIVSLRDINTILAINRDTLEKEWVISSTVPASYAFSSTFDKFYQPHDGAVPRRRRSISKMHSSRARRRRSDSFVRSPVRSPRLARLS